MEHISFLNLARDNERYSNEFKEAAARVIDSGWYIMGKELQSFEEKFASYCNTSYCIGVGNGLDALHLLIEAYKAIGKLHEGDEVILPGNTFIATALAVSMSGLNPVFADCDLDSYNISAESVKQKLSNRTRAIIAVHLYGHVAPMSELKELAYENDLLLIEDAAQAHGAVYNGLKAGSIGDAGIFSFYPVKNLGALGDAGAVTTNDALLAEKVRSLSNYGQSKKYYFDLKGFNSRLDELQAAFLDIRLQHLDSDNRQRKEIALYYLNHIHNENINLPIISDLDNHVFHLFVIRTIHRDILQSYLLEHGIETLIHYPVAVHMQEAYNGRDKICLPIVEQLQNEVLSLPLYPSLHRKEIGYIVDTINKFSI